MKTKLIIALVFLTTIISCKEESKTKGSEKTVYSCTMHHQVREDKSGPCPICGMTMVIVPDITNW
jgi:hypothetical protein